MGKQKRTLPYFYLLLKKWAYTLPVKRQTLKDVQHAWAWERKQSNTLTNLKEERKSHTLPLADYALTQLLDLPTASILEEDTCLPFIL